MLFQVGCRSLPGRGGRTLVKTWTANQELSSPKISGEIRETLAKTSRFVKVTCKEGEMDGVELAVVVQGLGKCRTYLPTQRKLRLNSCRVFDMGTSRSFHPANNGAGQ